MNTNDNMDNEESAEYGVTVIGDILPLSPSDHGGPSGGDISKEVLHLANDLGRIFHADWDGVLGDEAAGTAVDLMQELSRSLDYIRSASDTLTRALSSKELEVRVSAANVLAKLKGIDVSPLVPVLAEAVSSDDVITRRIVAETIGHVGAAASSRLPVVLRDSDRLVRQFGLTSAQRLGPGAASATNALIEIVQNDQEGPETDEIPQIYLRMDACDALRAIGQDASEAIPHLLSVIANTDSSHEDESWLRLRAAQAHFAITSEIEPCLGIAVEMLDHVSEKRFTEDTSEDFDLTFWLRSLACDVLAEIGPPARAAITRLERCVVEDPNKLVRRAAQNALFTILQDGNGI